MSPKTMAVSYDSSVCSNAVCMHIHHPLTNGIVSSVFRVLSCESASWPQDAEFGGAEALEVSGSRRRQAGARKPGNNSAWIIDKYTKDSPDQAGVPSPELSSINCCTLIQFCRALWRFASPLPPARVDTVASRPYPLWSRDDKRRPWPFCSAHGR